MGSLFRRSYIDRKTGKRRKVKHWSYSWIDEQGVRHVKTLPVENQHAAKELARKLQEDIDNGVAGVASYDATRLANPVELAREFEGVLKRKNRDPDHYQVVGARLRRMLDGVQSISELTPKRIREIIEAVADERGSSARTQNRYRGALNSFFNFLVKEGRWKENPVARVDKLDERSVAPKFERRPLTMDEMRRFFDPELWKSSEERRRWLCYLVAATSGLRRKELRRLLWSQFNPATGVISLKSWGEKNRLGNSILLPQGTVTALTENRGQALDSDPIFPVVPSIALLKRDLARAEIPFESAQGRVDFHALRYSFSTALAETGAPQAVHQKLLRHSDPKLTQNVYTKLGQSDVMQQAIKRIDVFGAASMNEDAPPACAHKPPHARPPSVAARPTEQDPTAQPVEPTADLLRTNKTQEESSGVKKTVSAPEDPEPNPPAPPRKSRRQKDVEQESKRAEVDAGARISKPAHSTALAPLQKRGRFYPGGGSGASGKRRRGVEGSW